MMIYDTFDIVFMGMGVIMLCMFVYTIVRCINRWNDNNHSPKLTVDARVVTKRMHLTHHNHVNGGDATGMMGMHTDVHTTYYVTFEVESGDRIEFAVSGQEYGMLEDDDEGRLTFQGTRFLGFERNR